jgi:hypothetical protein
MKSIEILHVFGVTDPLPNSIIESNTLPLFDLDGDLNQIIPSYMAWCVMHDHSDGNIVIDGTVSALSEIGRAKKADDINYIFKSGCSVAQKALIIRFLEWCLNKDLLDQVQIERAIKQWLKNS